MLSCVWKELQLFRLAVGSISAALSCLVCVPPQEDAFGGGVRAPFPNNGCWSSLPLQLLAARLIGRTSVRVGKIRLLPLFLLRAEGRIAEKAFNWSLIGWAMIRNCMLHEAHFAEMSKQTNVSTRHVHVVRAFWHFFCHCLLFFVIIIFFISAFYTCISIR